MPARPTRIPGIVLASLEGNDVYLLRWGGGPRLLTGISWNLIAAASRKQHLPINIIIAISGRLSWGVCDCPDHSVDSDAWRLRHGYTAARYTPCFGPPVRTIGRILGLCTLVSTVGVRGRVGLLFARRGWPTTCCTPLIGPWDHAESLRRFLTVMARTTERCGLRPTRLRWLDVVECCRPVCGLAAWAGGCAGRDRLW